MVRSSPVRGASYRSIQEAYALRAWALTWAGGPRTICDVSETIEPTLVIRTAKGLVLESGGRRRRAPSGAAIDSLFVHHAPEELIAEWLATAELLENEVDVVALAPISQQEVWAAGVTYLRSRDARVAESEDAGGDTFYDLVYDAPRPELFFKATPHRVVDPGGAVRIRTDSTWDVPEPEFTLAINAAGKVFGCTIGNDMSSRSIEGENPLYLPQAKMYSACASLGPGLLVGDLPPSSTEISLAIHRNDTLLFEGTTHLSQIKRDLHELADWLYRDNDFPHGAYLMTGTGIVPDDDFTLHTGDEIRIAIDGLGELVNHVG